MRATSYLVTVRCSAHLLSPLTELVDGDPECEIVSVELSEAPPSERRRSSHYRDTHYANGKRNKGIGGRHLLLRALGTGDKTMEQLQAIFHQNGFARSSVSPCRCLAQSSGLLTYEQG